MTAIRLTCLLLASIACLTSEPIAGATMSGGRGYNCAVSEGSLECWGEAWSNALDFGTLAAPVSGFGTDEGPIVSDVDSADNYLCFVADGGLYCFGDGFPSGAGGVTTSDKPTPQGAVNLGSLVTAVSSSHGHTCAVQDGGIVCFGENEYGKRGFPADQDIPLSATAVPGLEPGSNANVTAVAAGRNHTCAIKQGGVLCWGANDHYQLGRPGAGSHVPGAVPWLGPGVVSNVSQLVIPEYGDSTCALQGDKATCWGSQTDGVLGNNMTGQGPAPVVLADNSVLTGIVKLAAGDEHVCALTATQLYCWGVNMRGQLGSAFTPLPYSAVAIPISAGEPIVDIGASSDGTCLKRADGSVICWGSNFYGQIGLGLLPAKPVPTLVQGIGGAGAFVEAGSTHTCAQVQGAAKCWGNDTEGQLGNIGSFPYSGTPTFVFGLSANVSRISAGRHHSCAVVSGSAKCWGDSAYTGQADSGDDPTPVQVAGLESGVTRISAGAMSSCAVGSSGLLSCWGANSSGQLGTSVGEGNHVPTPVPVEKYGTFPGTSTVNAVDVSVGAQHACAVVDGGAMCWGNNDHGQLGTGDEDDRNGAVFVSGFGPNSGVVQVAAGDIHTCALAAGKVFCWGNNALSQLGTDVSNQSVPNEVADAQGATLVATGDYHTCAAFASEVKCWGSNRYGQVGNGAISEEVNEPAKVLGLTSVSSLSAGNRHTCATTASGTYCWGSEMYGALGNSQLGIVPAPDKPVMHAEIFSSGFEQQ